MADITLKDQSTNVLTFTVTDKETQLPIDNATVTVKIKRFDGYIMSQGTAIFVADGTYTYTFEPNVCRIRSDYTAIIKVVDQENFETTIPKTVEIN